MTQYEIVNRIRSAFGEKLGTWREMKSENAYQHRMGSYLEVTDPSIIRDLAFFLRDESDLSFDTLMLLSSLDNGDGTLSVVYNLESVKNGHQLALKVTLPADNAHVLSVTDVWAHANWQEREAWDMMGIRFG